uniref:Uncharacterized protein n=1 Tax=Branchiostoma floridae TaxID=7739 RepID=C3ZL40_BRAFL|eukprot:XP_002590711.1 hypothetical protein BRAFLDRAFT_89517 [Branchiostoma floridae]
MGRKLRRLLMFLLIILKEPNMPEADCSCAPSSSCVCRRMGLTSIPQNLPTNIHVLDLSHQISCDRSAKLQKQKLTDVNPEELICEEPTMPTLAANTQVTLSNGTAVGSRVGLAVWFKMRNKSLPPGPASGPHSNISLSATNTTVVAPSGHDHHHEGGTQHGQTEQGQSQADIRNKVLAALKPNPMYPSVGTPPKDPQSTIGHDQTEQGQSQASNTFNTKNAATVVTSSHDHQYENVDAPRHQTDPGVYKSVGQSQAVTESLGATNKSYGTGPTTSKTNTLYKEVGQYQAIAKPNINANSTAPIEDSGQDHMYE